MTIEKGLDEAKHMIHQTLTLPITHPSLFSSIRGGLSKGLLLYGPTGCGKSLLANAIASRLPASFFHIKGPSLLSKYIGASEKAVRQLFEKARKAAPSIIFFDEFEAIAAKR